MEEKDRWLRKSHLNKQNKFIRWYTRCVATAITITACYLMTGMHISVSSLSVSMVSTAIISRKRCCLLTRNSTSKSCIKTAVKSVLRAAVDFIRKRKTSVTVMIVQRKSNEKRQRNARGRRGRNEKIECSVLQYSKQGKCTAHFPVRAVWRLNL